MQRSLRHGRILCTLTLAYTNLDFTRGFWREKALCQLVTRKAVSGCSTPPCVTFATSKMVVITIVLLCNLWLDLACPDLILLSQALHGRPEGGNAHEPRCACWELKAGSFCQQASRQPSSARPCFSISISCSAGRVCCLSPAGGGLHAKGQTLPALTPSGSAAATVPVSQLVLGFGEQAVPTAAAPDLGAALAVSKNAGR